MSKVKHNLKLKIGLLEAFRNNNIKILATTGMILAIMYSSSANAISNGDIDTSNNFSFVGIHDLVLDGQIYGSCSGSLISSKLFLGAGHCTIFNNLLQQPAVSVSFDVDVRDPVLVVKQELFTHHGTMITNPLFYENANIACLINAQGDGEWMCADHQNNREDTSIIVFDEAIPASEIAPVTIADPGHISSKSKAELQSTPFTVAGYGRTEPGNLFTLGVRRTGTMKYNSHTSAYVNLAADQTTTNQNACLGDSGGAVLEGDDSGSFNNPLQVAVIHGGDAACMQIDQTRRLDTKSQKCFRDVVQAAVDNGNLLPDGTSILNPQEDCSNYYINGNLTACPLYKAIDACINS